MYNYEFEGMMDKRMLKAVYIMNPMVNILTRQIMSEILSNEMKRLASDIEYSIRIQRISTNSFS
ncbi:MAG: hypothetical protein ACP5T9_06320 [Thermoplasmata archaeon]